MPLSNDLAHVGILELLQSDDRPTFVLSSSPCESTRSQVVYRNPALESLFRSNLVAFEQWAGTINLEGSSWHFDGREWTGTTIRDRWTVIYCKQSHNGGVSPGTVPLQNGKAAIPSDQSMDSVPPEFHGSIIPTCRTTQTSTEVATIPVWPKLEIAGDASPHILDWTRYPIDNLTEHERFVKSVNWGLTSVGPITAWPIQLRMLVIATFRSPNPRIIFWGADHVMIYNAAAVSRLGSAHPNAMGKPVYEACHQLWPTLAPLIKPAILYGKPIRVDKELVFLERNGITEETWWSFTISPIIGPNGYAVGAVDTFIELTSSVILQRRREILNKLNEDVARVSTLKDLWTRFVVSLDPSRDDIPYSLIYAVDDSDSTASTSSWAQPTRSYTLEAYMGIDPSHHSSIPKSFDLLKDSSEMSGTIQACRMAWDLRQTVVLRKEDGTLPLDLAVAIPNRGYGDPVQTVCVMPLAPGGSAFLIVGLNPRRPYTDETLRFAHSLHDVLAKPSAVISQQKFEEIHDSLSLQLRASTLEAARNEEKFTKMAETSPIGICTFTPDGRTLYVNDQYLSLIGVKRVFDQSFLDNEADWRDKVVPEDMILISEGWQQLVDRRASTVNIRYRLKKPWKSRDNATGSEITGETCLLNKATVELDSNGNVAFIHAWLLDVSHQQYTEGILGRRLEEALETKRQTEKFIDMVSHELSE